MKSGYKRLPQFHPFHISLWFLIWSFSFMTLAYLVWVCYDLSTTGEMLWVGLWVFHVCVFLFTLIIISGLIILVAYFYVYCGVGFSVLTLSVSFFVLSFMLSMLIMSLPLIMINFTYFIVWNTCGILLFSFSTSLGRSYIRMTVASYPKGLNNPFLIYIPMWYVYFFYDHTTSRVFWGDGDFTHFCTTLMNCISGNNKLSVYALLISQGHRVELPHQIAHVHYLLTSNNFYPLHK